MAEDELKGIFDRLDPAGTGSIGYDEFVVASLNEKVLLHQDKLKKAVSMEVVVPVSLRRGLCRHSVIEKILTPLLLVF